MAIALGTRLAPVTFELPKLQLPFEQMQAQIQGMQQEKDIYEQMRELSPQYVEADKPLVQAALKEVDDLVKGVSEGFATGRVSEAMKGLRDAKGVLSSMWKPTGVFGSVQGFYQDYQKALEEVKEFTKDNTDPAYKYVYTNLVRQAAEEGSGYDPLTGGRKTISAPNMMKEVNVLKETDDFLKDWKADTRTGIERRGEMFYWVGTTEQVSKAELSKAMSAFMKDPRIDYAINVQAQYRAGMAGAEGQQAVLGAFQQEQKDRIKTASDMLSQIEKDLNSGNYKDIVAAQRKLGVKADGVIGDKTNDALADLRSEVDNMSKINYGDLDATSVYKLRIQQDMQDALLDKYAYTKQTGKLEWDRLALQRRQMNAMRNLMMEFQPPSQMPLLTVKDTAQLNLPSPIDMMNKSKTNYKNAVEVAKQGLGGLSQVFDATGQRYGVVVGEFSAAVSKGLANAGVTSMANMTEQQKQLFKRGFEQSLQNSGVSNKKMSYSDMANRFLAEGDAGRVKLDNQYDVLTNSWSMYKANVDIVERVADEVVKDNKLLEGFVKDSKRSTLMDSPTSLKRETIDLPDSKFKTVSQVKDLLAKRDPATLKELDKYLNKIKLENPTLHKKVLGSVYTYGVDHDEMSKSNKQLTEAIGQNIGTVIDMSMLDKEQRKLLTVKGKFRQDLKLSDAVITNMSGNGTNQQMLTLYVQEPVKGGFSQAVPVTVPVEGLKNKEWVRNYIVTQAAVAFDYERMTPKNEEVFYRSMSQLFDMDNQPSTGFDANTIRRKANTYNEPGVYQLPPVRVKDSYITPYLNVTNVGKSYVLPLTAQAEETLASGRPLTGTDMRGVLSQGLGSGEISHDAAVSAILNVKAMLQSGDQNTLMELGRMTKLTRQYGDKQQFFLQAVMGSGFMDDTYDVDNEPEE